MEFAYRNGLKFMIRSISWRFKTFLSKKIIAFQDKLGLFSYERWYKQNEISEEDFEKKIEVISTNGKKPLISILLPISSDSLYYLPDTLNSLISQSYNYWEAYVIPLGTENLDNVIHIFRQSISDPRIRLFSKDKNDREANTLADSLQIATGDYVIFIQAGDSLHIDTFYCVATRIIQEPTVDILYYDEDHLSEDGQKRHSPFLKPDWSPELLLSVNYLLHAFIKRQLLVSVSQESQSYEEAIFRSVERSSQIVHIPKILYHSRKPNPILDSIWYSSMEDHCRLVEDHIRRCGIPTANVDYQKGSLRLTWPAEEKLVSIIILNKDRVTYLERCISSLMAITRYKKFEVIVMDNASNEPETRDYYRHLIQLPHVTLVENQTRFNFSAYNNLAVSHAKGELLLFLNNDIEVIDPDWLEELVRWAELPEIGVVGAKLLYPDGLIQHAGIVLGLEGHASHVFLGVKDNESSNIISPFGSVNWYRDYSAVTGACMMFKRNVFKVIGGFNEEYDLVFSDIEVCLRAIKAGYRVMYNPFARLIHYEGKTRARYIPSRDIYLGREHFKDIIENGDPYYNPWLSYSVRIPTLRRKGEEIPIQRLQHIVEFTRGSVEDVKHSTC